MIQRGHRSLMQESRDGVSALISTDHTTKINTFRTFNDIVISETQRNEDECRGMNRCR